MKDQYWVGTLMGVGEVVYDPSIQDDESNFVRLFRVGAMELGEFDRAKTRGKIKKLRSSRRQDQCVERFEEWKDQSVLATSSAGLLADIGLVGSKIEENETTASTGLERVVDSFETLLKARDSDIETLQKEKALLQEELSLRQKTLVDAQARINNLERKVTSLRRQLDRQEKRLSIAKAEAAELSKRAKAADKTDEFNDLARNAALFAANGHEEFRRLILTLSLNARLPIEIAARLETRLRRKLHESDPSVSLFELLRQSEEMGVLDEPCLEMAHIIRKQRNAIAHAKYTNHDATARILMVLYAAAILWPRLS